MRRAALSALVIITMIAGAARAADYSALVLDGDADRLIETLREDRTDLDHPNPGTGLSPLAIAAVRGRADLVAILLDAGADPEAAGPAGMSALSAIARSCHADPSIVSMMLEAGADPDSRSGAGITPAMAAIQVLRPDVALQIIEAGANIDAVNQYGDGLLNFAIYFEAPEVISALLDLGVNTEQLRVAFTTTGYYQLGFGGATADVRRQQCEATRD